MEALGRATASRRSRRRSPRLAVLLEPLLGVTLTPTMVSASEKINVIPSRAELKVDCRVPPGQGEETALERIHELLGERRATRCASTRRWSGNSSPTEGVADGFDPRLRAGGGPRRRARARRAARASATRAGSARRSPTASPTASSPSGRWTCFEVMPLVHGADERIPVEDLGLAARAYRHLAQELLA